MFKISMTTVNELFVFLTGFLLNFKFFFFWLFPTAFSKSFIQSRVKVSEILHGATISVVPVKSQVMAASINLIRKKFKKNHAFLTDSKSRLQYMLQSGHLQTCEMLFNISGKLSLINCYFKSSQGKSSKFLMPSSFSSTITAFSGKFSSSMKT